VHREKAKTGKGGVETGKSVGSGHESGGGTIQVYLVWASGGGLENTYWRKEERSKNGLSANGKGTISADCQQQLVYVSRRGVPTGIPGRGRREAEKSEGKM